MGLAASSCMGSSAISAAVFSPNSNKKKKHREVLPHSSSTYSNCDEKQSLPFCKVPRRKDDSMSKNVPPLRVDTVDESDHMQNLVISALLTKKLPSSCCCFRKTLLIILPLYSIVRSPRNDL